MTQRIARRKLPDDRDRGFTLVELILVVVMLGLVTGVIAAAVIVFIKSEDGVVATAAESQDTRQVVNYFPLDIESGPSRADAYRATVGGASGDSGSGCSDAGTENVLRIDVTDRRLDLVDKRIAYRLVTTGAQGRIDRYVCTFDGSAWTEETVINVADFLDATASPVAEAEVVVSNPGDPVANQEVEGVELRYVQRGDTESISAAPREEQPLSTSGVCGSDPLDATHEIATFVEGDVILHGTSVKSSLFVGGTLTFHNSSVAQSVPDAPSAPFDASVGLVAGSVDWTNSTGTLDVKPHRGVLIEDGNYYTPDANGPITASASSSSPSITLGNSATVFTPGATRLVVPGEAFSELRACSDRLAELPNSCDNGACAAFVGLPANYSGTATDPGPQLKLDLSSDKANAFNIDEANLLDLEEIQVGFDPSDQPDVANPLIINVRSAIGGTVNFEAPDIQGSGSNSVYIVWNFPNAAVVNVLASNQLRGTLLAPYSDVTSEVSIEGGVIANRFEMFGSSLNDVRTFHGALAW
jgi:choice-of-anchor A domain-containing protein/prepilin-type N-terminal cleavage/methylation domain-containing protein